MVAGKGSFQRRPPIESFYVYKNWTNTFAKIHHGSSPYCNDGRGFQGGGTRHQVGSGWGHFHLPAMR